ncbi:MAG: zinc ribbon domain-containing protein [Candidatus Lokiarchaeota archaeon]|nr:zinc ribbon domain-containing protein [Candidatus Lokiarchaeota archaeon]
MVTSPQYVGFGNMGKSIKDTAFAMALGTLVLPLATAGSFILMSFIGSRYYSIYGPEALTGSMIAAYCIVGGLALLFYLASINYRIRTYKAMKEAGQQSGNSDVSALAKHWFVELVMTVATAPLYAVTGITLVARACMPYSIPYSPAVPLLLLANWFAMVFTGMYSVVDGNKKWEPVGLLLTSYKGRAGMQYLRSSQGVGFAIFVISHYAMAFLIATLATAGTCSSYPYGSYCTPYMTMGGILFPIGVATAILTLVGMVNHIKGLFRVGNTLIDLEEGRASPSPYGAAAYGTSYYRPQASPYGVGYGAPAYGGAYGAPSAAGGGYQHGTWDAPRYSQPGSRDTGAVDAGWNVGASAAVQPGPAREKGRCSNCHASLPESEDVTFCPYCGSRV